MDEYLTHLAQRVEAHIRSWGEARGVAITVRAPLAGERPRRRAENDSAAARESRSWIVTGVDAIVGFTYDAGGHGTGGEQALAGRRTANLWFSLADWIPSRNLVGCLIQAPTVFAELEGDGLDDDSLASAVEAFFDTWWPAIDASRRRRDIAALRFGRLQQAIADAYGRVDVRELAGLWLSGAALKEIVEIPGNGVANSSVQEMADLADACRIPLAEYLTESPLQLDSDQEQHLENMCDEYSLDHGEHGQLRREAARQLNAGVLRYPLRSIEDWVRFRRDMRRAT